MGDMGPKGTNGKPHVAPIRTSGKPGGEGGKQGGTGTANAGIHVKPTQGRSGGPR